MPTPEAFFLPASLGRAGQRFCIFHPAQGPHSVGCILYIHPFAEEMNKSRRMAALQARALAQAGYAVLQIDLLGCGDSSGEFNDATWQDWINDVVSGWRWLSDHSQAPLWLWGLRAGCLLAADAARQLEARCNFMFWAPTMAGKLQLHQFLRLRAAAELLEGNSKGVTEGLRQQLTSGYAVEIAGYTVSPGLALGMDNSILAPLPPLPTGGSFRLEWFEMSTREDAKPSPAASKTFSEWDVAGFEVRSHMVRGPSFWQTTEIEDAPALLSATVAALSTFPLPQKFAA